jgi:cysteine synthase A
MDRAGHDGDRVLVGIDRGVGGVFRPDAGLAVHRRSAGDDRQAQARRDPLPRRRDPHGRRSAHRLCSHRLAAETGGHYLDQFTYAERATDWRGNNNIAESIFAQMAEEEHPCPCWIVCGAGTGGTSATIGRFIRYCRHDTKLCVADPVHSVFHRYFEDRSVVALPEGCASRIEGIGRPRVEPSFVPSVIDRMIAVEDADSIGAMRALSDRLGRRVGGSTGTNLWACAQIVEEMAAAGETGSIVTLLCDGGDRYGCTYYDDAWLDERQVAWTDAAARMTAFLG